MADDRWPFDGIFDCPYVIIGVYNMPHLNRHPAHRSIDFLLFPSEKLWLQGFLAIMIVAIAVLLFSRYLMGPKHQIGQRPENEKILTLFRDLRWY